MVRGGFYTGAVYLAGHAVECMLKALLISRHPVAQRQNVYMTCRQEIGHNLEELNVKPAVSYLGLVRNRQEG